MSSEDTATRLAAYAAELTLDDVDEETRNAAKIRILDSIATAIGAATEPEEPVEQLVEFAAGKGDTGGCSLLGMDQQAPLEYAGLANATLIRYLDWNDYHADQNRHGVLSIGHASSNLGGVLPAAEAYGANGRDLLLAVVLSYELHMRMAEETAQSDDGFDHVNYGLVATTLAVGRLRGLKTAELAEAVNIALSGHLSVWQTRCGALTEWKGIAFGNTVRNAITAVDLAAAGIHGPAPIFEGEGGISNLLSNPIELDPETFGGNNGDFKIHDTGIKPYPVCGAIQEPLDCVFELLEEESFGWRDITKIEIETQSDAIDLTAADDEKWDPQNRNTADHSLPYCVARALIDLEMGPQQLTHEKITDQTVRTLMDRIDVTENPDETRVIVRTDSTEVVKNVGQPRGSPERPFTLNDVVEKLETVTAADAQAEEISAWVREMESKNSAATVLELTRHRSATSP